jgi:teichoic acid transport system permease protein
VSFGISTIFLNIGVYINDVFNVLQALLRLLFYLSGIFYSIDTMIGKKYPVLATALAKWNPAAFLMIASRTVLLEQRMPDYTLLGIWCLIGFAISALGVSLIYRNENNYVKLI